jgi:hypothetical protein
MEGFGFQKMMGFGRRLCDSTMTHWSQVIWALQVLWSLWLEAIGVGTWLTGSSNTCRVVTLADE